VKLSQGLMVSDLHDSRSCICAGSGKQRVFRLPLEPAGKEELGSIDPRSSFAESLIDLIACREVRFQGMQCPA